MNYKTKGGYFTEVGGYPVKREPANMPHTDWQTLPRRPIGIVFHYTVGCNDDIKGTLEANSFGGAQFNVGRRGQIFQYAPLDVATFHANHESHFFWGIEHTAYPGHGCELNDKQLEASANLSAALLAYSESRGTKIPLRHLPNARMNDYLPGFHDHRDFAGDGLNSHTDHLYHWTWPKYLAAVAAAGSGGDDMAYADFIAGIDRAKDGKPLPPGANVDFQRGFHLKQQAQEKQDPAPAGKVPPHSHTLPVKTGDVAK